ncbi:MAG: class I SAM-dependent methyltransferase, partial [Leptospirales bacterium]|nr:class I SAM-dependent methyltransferase [Leptospirales bacterium]
MGKSQTAAPEHTAVRVALWRALHVRIDAEPHVFVDEIGEKIIGEENWRARADMAPEFSKSMRASVTGRARFIEDIVEEKVNEGVTQYVILGAGIDTFAQRRGDLASRLQVFEVDQPGPQMWKRQRLAELEFDLPASLHFVAVDFEAGESWKDELLKAGFDKSKPTIFASTGVSMYLSRDANAETFGQIARLAPGSIFVTTFMLALELLNAQERSIMEFVMNKARESGTPFLSLFAPEEIVSLAKSSGFRTAEYVSASEIFDRYFAGRSDGLRAGDA